ncbi:hypothetical protein ABTE82_19730, partial [Acinetobacter baumannii]
KKSVTATLLEGNLVFVDELNAPEPELPLPPPARPSFSPGGPLSVPILDDDSDMMDDVSMPSHTVPDRSYAGSSVSDAS